MSLSCDETEGMTFIGSAPHPKKVVKRINEMIKEICQLRKDYEKSKYEISLYCIQPTEESPEDPTTEEECFPQCDDGDTYVEYYQISDDHITTELLEFLSLVEQNICETKTGIEILNIIAKEECEGPGEYVTANGSSFNAPPSGDPYSYP